MSPRMIVMALVSAALAVGGCGGDSEQDQARDQACDARADISRQVQKLEQLTPSTFTVDTVKTSVEAIQQDLKDIGAAQDELSDDLRSQFKAANDAFVAELQQIGSALLKSTSVAEAKTQLEAAATALAQSYRTTLASVDCGT